MTVVQDENRFTRLEWISAGIAVLLVMVTIWLIPVGLSARNNATQVERGTQLASCRADAWAEVAVAESLAQALIIDALAASQRGKDAEFNRLIEQEAPEVSQQLRVSQLAYQVAVDHSIEDPEAFLEDCSQVR